MIIIIIIAIMILLILIRRRGRMIIIIMRDSSEIDTAKEERDVRDGRGRQRFLITILLPERNLLLFYSQRGILYYSAHSNSTPREESFTIPLILILRTPSDDCPRGHT